MNVIDLIIELAQSPENVRADGSINWDFVSADLHIDHKELVEGLTAEEEDSLLDRAAKRMGV